MQTKSKERTFYTHQTGKNVKVPKYQMLVKMWSNRAFLTWLVEVQTVTTTLENNLAFSSKFDGTYIL